MLEAHSLPLRNYLMKYMMPFLSEAMLDCSKLKPDDPVDFLVFFNINRVNTEPKLLLDRIVLVKRVDMSGLCFCRLNIFYGTSKTDQHIDEDFLLLFSDN